MILEIIEFIVIMIGGILFSSEYFEENGCCAFLIITFLLSVYFTSSSGVKFLLFLFMLIIGIIILHKDNNNENTENVENTQNYPNQYERNYEQPPIERIPQQPNNYYDYNEPQQINIEFEPVYEAPQYEQPQYEQPQYEQPQYEQPQKEINYKIDVNYATKDELMSLPYIDSQRADKILDYTRINHIDSMEELNSILNLTNIESNILGIQLNLPASKEKQDYTTKHRKDKPSFNKLFNKKEEKNNDNEKLNDKRTNNNLVDINRAGVDELKRLPAINLIKAKKIVQLRENDIYIESFSDLQQKINLKDYEVEELKNLIIISEIEPTIHGRRIDL